MSDPHRLSDPYYAQRVAGTINGLLSDVIAIGLLLLSFNYIRLILEYPELLGDPELWKRLVLLLLAIAFIAYDVLAYKTHLALQEGETRPADGGSSPRRILALYFIDLFRIGVSAWLLAALAIGDLAEDPLNAKLRAELAVGPSLFATVFTFVALWHATIGLWYVVEGSNRRNKRLHAAYALGHAAAAFFFAGLAPASYAAAKDLWDLAATGWLALLIALVYRTQVMAFLRSDMERAR
ncbi:hypothetical protein SAMN05660831_02030 [Thiohalospira halophila DSM 15071]|uniref:Uncharacterized protein n=1 Tax=Thiohalospira halophila DSM 15071 TaxID=1123397 RepID=A0A1I1U528_9GAMM|nr:hypothetical protein [Thiohalospira halophila]SFD65794.1 hypothetical protein SAMN05660831_02030 [Thiohalospira halophila DSM 15071]